MHIGGAVRRGLGATWNGPFYIGRLTRPVSVGDALMKVMETGWRATLLAGGAAVVVALGVTVADAMREENPYDAYTDVTAAQTYTLPELIASAVAFDRGACPDHRKPLHVSLTNNSDANVGLIVYTVDVREAGRSTVLNSRATSATGEEQDQLWFTDTILAPGQTEASCSPMPNLSERPSGERELTYQVRITDAQPTDLPALKK